MKKQFHRSLISICMILGILLTVGSFILVLGSQLSLNAAAAENREILRTLHTILPDTQNAVPEERSTPAMPMFEIDGENLIAILNIPAYQTELPICGIWNKNKITQRPCRYTGSIYDNSLIIGGCDRSGQFDFTKRITNGDLIFLTDMTSMQYTYVVDSIIRTNDVSTENLSASNADLVLFARNTYGFDYTVIHCVRTQK